VTYISSAQEKQDFVFNDTPLIDVINQLQKQYDIRFSYASDAIEGKQVTFSIDRMTWVELLDVLEAYTGLVFKKISDTQVIISPRDSNNQLCGYLLDKETQLPLAYTVIIISENEQIVTDATGFFAFAKADSAYYTLHVAGYNTIDFSETEGCSQVFASLNNEALDEVIITGYVTSGIDRNKDGSLDVTQKTLGILPGLVTPDLLQSIQLIPGVSTLDESASGIQIRGGSPDQNLILYDGIKLFNSGYLYGIFSAFNPYATEKARIYRSGTSAVYGDRISGIIDISTGEKIPKKVSYGFGIDGLSIDGYVKTPLSEKSALYVFARRSYTDILETPTYRGYEDKIFTNFGVVRDVNGNILELETDDDFNRETSTNDFSFADVSAKYIAKINEKNTLSFSSLYTRNRLDFNFTGGDELIVDSLITQNKGLSVDWKHKTSDRQKERITAYYSDYNSFYQNNEIKDETGDGIVELAQINIRDNTIRDFGVNVTVTRQIKERQQLNFGYQFSYTDLDVVIRTENPIDNEIEDSGQDDNNLKNAVFGEYTYNFKNKGHISGGVRLVHYNSVNQFLVEPRINLEYPLGDRFRFKTAIERRNQPISQLVEFNNTEIRLENNLWRLSDDEEFPLLNSNQVSGGLLYYHNGLNIDVDAYYKELDGLTTFTNGFSNPLENLEKGESTIKGLDVLVKYKWDQYKIWAGYSYNDITFQFPNLPETPSKFPGNNDITHQFRISNTLTLDNWQFSLGWQYRTGSPITPVNSFDINIDADGENAGVVSFGAINSGRLPDFHRLDASILYDFPIKYGNKQIKSQVGFSLLNIYNRVVPLNLIYKAERKPLDDGGIAVPGTDGSSPEELEPILEQVIQRFSLGITPNVSFRVFF
jgi:hypothetical protein